MIFWASPWLGWRIPCAASSCPRSGKLAWQLLFQDSTSGAPSRLLQTTSSSAPSGTGREEGAGGGERESYEREREKEPEEEEEGFGQEGRGEFSCRAGMCGISCSASSRGPCPSSWVSCSACTAGLLSELSVQRESRFYAAFVSLRCQHSPRWMQVV